MGGGYSCVAVDTASLFLQFFIPIFIYIYIYTQTYIGMSRYIYIYMYMYICICMYMQEYTGIDGIDTYVHRLSTRQPPKP